MSSRISGRRPASDSASAIHVAALVSPSGASAGGVFAADSDAHTTAQLRYAETAVAHARLAAIPADRIVNYWPTDRLLAWLADRSSAAA